MKTIIIGIAGGTGSGKSTFTRKLKKEFKDDVAVLYHDNYYRDQSDIPLEERRKTNYDHPDAMETYLTTVKPMHYLYVEPTRSTADIVINSGMNPIAFELVKNTIQKILDEEA